MPLSAKNYVTREDAAAAGRRAGDSYALAVLVVLAFISYHDALGLSQWQTIFLGGLVAVGLRVGTELWMGASWDHYDRRRTAHMSQGASSHEAFNY